MNPVNNPYTAGAGTFPPMLAGREALLNRVEVTIARLRIGRSGKSMLMVGRWGAGKTVLLQQMRLDAEGVGVHTLLLTNPETLSLPAMLANQLHLVLQRLSCKEAARASAQRASHALAYFAQALKGTVTDIPVDLEFDADGEGKGEGELAGNGDLHGDLSTVLELAGLAAKAASTVLVIFIDEFHLIEETQLGALIAALHRCTQSRLPVMLVGAGLPHLRKRAGNAKSYAERLFDFPEIGALSEMDSGLAIIQPAEKLGVAFEAAAVALIVEESRCHPYFLQEWCKHVWDTACESPITVADVQKASAQTIAALYEGFFRGRFDRLTSKEKKFLRALANLGPGPHLTAKIADHQGRRVQAVTPVRDSLMSKGLIWSPSLGETAFAIPFFCDFMKRALPDDEGT